ncbi:BirA family transcriptional regulator, biotin operon repressor [Angomonas deanei]|nr:BirA family transcriptional regulator, biotin operon repressor [Angomonas deanei]|eukprot:EPY40032.1 BirA family transcriptional regulator, biotin operon repressor [Angomonas deanei]
MYFTLCVPLQPPTGGYGLSQTLLPVLPLLCGLVCREAVYHLVEEVLPAGDSKKMFHLQTKWPNDIVYHGKKLGGSLVEPFDEHQVLPESDAETVAHEEQQQEEAASPTIPFNANYVLIGIGLNVAAVPVLQDGGRVATCIQDVLESFCKEQHISFGESGVPRLSPRRLAHFICEAFLPYLTPGAHTPDRKSVVSEFEKYMDKSLVLHKRVTTADGQQTREEVNLKALRLNEWGHLTVRNPYGAEETLCAEYLY